MLSDHDHVCEPAKVSHYHTRWLCGLNLHNFTSVCVYQNMIVGCNIQNKHFRLLNYILNYALFIIYKCIVIRNFENKQYNNIKVKSMFIQELENQICIDVKAQLGQKFFSRGDIDLVKYYLI